MSYDGRRDIERLIDGIVKTRAPRVYFIGLGGVSVSSLALESLERGYAVSGSDRSESELTDKVAAAGGEVHIGHDAANVRAFCPDLLVYSAAIHDDNPEMMAAREENIPVFRRAEYLGYIMSDSRVRVGVCGMHGKSTTTGLVSHLLIDGGLDPTVEVGAPVAELGGCCRDGEGGIFVYEACEYTDSFLYTAPTDVIVTNIDLEHLDWFSGLDAIIASFRRFISMSRRAVLNAADENIMRAAEGYEGEIITYSADPSVKADYTCGEIIYDHGHPSFDVYERGTLLLHASLGLAGAHNAMNALAAIAEARALGVAASSIERSLPVFTGCQRRFERIGVTKNGALFYDDYAHHPTEIAAILKTVKTLGCRRSVIIHQPHTYSRLQGLYDSYTELFRPGEILSDTDVVIFADIYAAREKAEDYHVSSERLAADTGRMYLGSFENIARWIDENTGEGDVVMTVGAGDVVKLTKMVAMR